MDDADQITKAPEKNYSILSPHSDQKQSFPTEREAIAAALEMDELMIVIDEESREPINIVYEGYVYERKAGQLMTHVRRVEQKRGS